MTLLMNLSSLMGEDFNLFLAESDISQNILQLISNCHNWARQREPPVYLEALHELRLATIRLFKNIVKALQQHPQLTVPLVAQLGKDEHYFEQHPSAMLLLLAEGMCNQEFWGGLLGREALMMDQIINGIGEIQNRCFRDSFLQDR